LEYQRAQHLKGIVLQLPIVEVADDIRQRPADIAWNQLEKLGGKEGEATELHLLVEKDGGDFRAVIQVFPSMGRVNFALRRKRLISSFTATFRFCWLR
jgi:hypothetical protein